MKCAVCGKEYNFGRLMTCSDECHEKLVEKMEKKFGKYKKVVDVTTGKSYKVPTKVIAEEGLRWEDLRKFPEWKDEKNKQNQQKHNPNLVGSEKPMSKSKGEWYPKRVYEYQISPATQKFFRIETNHHLCFVIESTPISRRTVEIAELPKSEIPKIIEALKTIVEG